MHVFDDKDHQDDSPQGHEDESYDAPLSAMVSQQQLASTMNKQTWGSLSTDSQKAWDTIPASDKAKILSVLLKDSDSEFEEIDEIVKQFRGQCSPR